MNKFKKYHIVENVYGKINIFKNKPVDVLSMLMGEAK